MTRNEALVTTNYTLVDPKKADKQSQSAAVLTAIRRLAPLLGDEKRLVAMAFVATLVSGGSSLLGPAVISHTVDSYIATGNFGGVLRWSGILVVIYLAGLLAAYFQTLAMGTVGRTVLFKLRNVLFTKLQDLPLAFFNQNKAGDLISRINNDTDKLNVFFAQSLVQLAGNVFMMIGAGIFLLVLNPRLGLSALVPGIGVLMFTQLLSSWVKGRNLKSLQSLGGMSGEIQESLSNFKVIVAFNRLDYFRQKFNEANQQNFKASVASGIANGVF